MPFSLFVADSAYSSMEQLHFFPLAVPSNVYGFAHLRGSDRSRVLVATLEKQIFCIEYSGNAFTCNEVHFTYIPSEAIHPSSNLMFNY